MGNNRLYLKMLLSSIILILFFYLLVNIYDFNSISVTILLGLSGAYAFISAILWRLAIVYQDLFYEYDNKYYIKYGKKLVLSKNDKYILKHICYTVHDRKKHKSFVNAFKTNNTSEINRYLLRNDYEINDKEKFNNVIQLISEYLSS